MNWSDILSTSAITTLGVASLAFLSREWISTRLRESIAAEYKEAFELFKQRILWEDKKKQQAVEVSELLSLWIQHNYDKSKDVNLMRYELQKKYWQLALWLDEPILLAVHKAFHSASAPGITHKEALIAVRKIIVGQQDQIKAEELFHFSPVEIENAKQAGA